MPEPSLANLARALKQQWGNYDEETLVVFELPDGTRYHWDNSTVAVDWDGEDAVIYLAEPYDPASEDDDDSDDDDDDRDDDD